MTVGSEVRPLVAGGSTVSVDLACLATAVEHLLPPEEPEAEQQRGHCPADAEQPQVAGDESRVAIGAPVLTQRMLPGQWRAVVNLSDQPCPGQVADLLRLRRASPGGALGGVVPLGPEGARALAAEQRVADQRDEDGSRVELEE